MAMVILINCVGNSSISLYCGQMLAKCWQTQSIFGTALQVANGQALSERHYVACT